MLTAHSRETKIHAMSIRCSQIRTIIEFSNDKTWKSTEPIEKFKTGKWSFENEARALRIIFGNSEKELSVMELTAGSLRYKYRQLGAVYTFDWVTKQ
jgi:hypothetical protein